MSEPWTREERQRAFAKANAEAGPNVDAIGKFIGCALGLVALILMVAAMAAVVVKLWRMALGG